MKKMMMMLLAGFMAIGASAQETKDCSEKCSKEDRRANAEERHERRRAETIEALQLTETQIAQWDEIHEKYRPERKKIKSESKDDREARREEMKAVREQMDAEIDQILTPDQRKTWAAMKKDKEAKRKHRQDVGPTVPRQ
ncbi:Spy/CpxP family protein refolding chaperone [Sanyastnella coralliicola]|uniref:Spy/CpxP family protein refolding chaperone n=1 Tax=Sanyastnella coralliicola TaxID=3069118 RepID=UPI0027B98F81|nr:Spy/CpxP family protein refolding chaperone [Longitalea sp. SCSIO 12813]